MLFTMTDSEVEEHRFWMQTALEEASLAAAESEVPIGAALLLDGNLLARDHNRSIQYRDPTAHAEILVLRKAARELENYRLNGAVLYVTVEPCVMCAGALIWSRVSRLVYGTADEKGGGVVSKVRVLEPGRFNHKVEVTGGIMADECRRILRNFFSARR